jgi:ParG
MPYQPPKGFIRMNLNVQEDLHTAFKVAVTSERKNMTDVLIELMQRYVAEHGPAAARKKKAKQ